MLTGLALPGIIGAGLFVGSSAVIGTVGPGAVMSYLFAGILVILVMRMLGEMAVANRAAFIRGRREREPAAARERAVAARSGVA